MCDDIVCVCMCDSLYVCNDIVCVCDDIVCVCMCVSVYVCDDIVCVCVMI